MVGCRCDPPGSSENCVGTCFYQAAIKDIQARAYNLLRDRRDGLLDDEIVDTFLTYLVRVAQ